MTNLCIFCGITTEEGGIVHLRDKGCKSINEISKFRGDNKEVSSNLKLN